MLFNTSSHLIIGGYKLLRHKEIPIYLHKYLS